MSTRESTTIICDNCGHEDASGDYVANSWNQASINFIKCADPVRYAAKSYDFCAGCFGALDESGLLTKATQLFQA